MHVYDVSFCGHRRTHACTTHHNVSLCLRRNQSLFFCRNKFSLLAQHYKSYHRCWLRITLLRIINWFRCIVLLVRSKKKQTLQKLGCMLNWLQKTRESPQNKKIKNSECVAKHFIEHSLRMGIFALCKCIKLWCDVASFLWNINFKRRERFRIHRLHNSHENSPNIGRANLTS